MSAAVSTARTPGSARARLASMRRMRAWAWGLRRSFAWSSPRGLRSATYWTWPVTFSGPSGRGMESPTPFTSRVVFIAMVAQLPSTSGVARPRPRRSRPPSSCSRCTGRGCRRSRSGSRPPSGAAFSARSAAAAIRTPGMQNPHWGTPWRTKASCSGWSAPCLPSPSIVRTERPAGLHGQDQAARDRLAVQVDRAGPAVAGPAPLLGPGEAEPLAERVQQGLVRLDEHLHRLSVHRAARAPAWARGGSSRDRSGRPRARAPW